MAGMNYEIENILLQMILAIEEGRVSDYLSLREELFDVLSKDQKPILRLV